ncbi:hypothetical protein PSCLAVI8L_180084 [Pseudoclavibacter sp. 8L]|nr:hypothetical protein PSCLAVI8L_180084 [Pseudoclavibacter sp. 8L]
MACRAQRSGEVADAVLASAVLRSFVVDGAVAGLELLVATFLAVLFLVLVLFAQLFVLVVSHGVSSIVFGASLRCPRGGVPQAERSARRLDAGRDWLAYTRTKTTPNPPRARPPRSTAVLWSSKLTEGNH